MVGRITGRAGELGLKTTQPGATAPRSSDVTGATGGYSGAGWRGS